MAQGRAASVRQDWRQHASLDRYCFVAEQVDAAQIAMKAARAEPVVDRAAAKAEVQQLLTGDWTTLVRGQIRRLLRRGRR